MDNWVCKDVFLTVWDVRILSIETKLSEENTKEESLDSNISPLGQH